MTRSLPAYDPALDPLAGPLTRYLSTGDEAAIDAVVRATRDRLLAAARRIGSRDDAEDAVQTAYLSLVRRRGGRLEAPVLPWLLTATIRTAYRKKALARRDARIVERLGRPDDPPSRADPDDVARLRREVARLPARYRDPVVLHDLAGLSTPETARLLDIPEPTVRTRLHRARRLVRSRWSPSLVAGVLTIPWFLVDRVRDASAAEAAVVGVGGAVKSTALVSTVAAAALGIGVGYIVSKSPSDSDRRARTAESRAASLEAEVAALKVKAAGGASLAGSAPRPPLQPARPPAEPPPTVAVADAPVVAAPPTSIVSDPRFLVAGLEDALKGIDWKAAGESVRALVPLIKDMGGEIASDRPLTVELYGKVQVQNGVLVAAAGKYAAKTGRGDDVTKVNSAFSEPAFMENLIASALAAAKLPLSEAQAQRLEALSERHAVDDARRLARYDDRAFALQRILDESTLRERFFADAWALLAPEQRAALGNPELEDRVQLDLFSAALLWTGITQPEAFSTRDALVALVERRAQAFLGLADDRKAVVHAAVTEWAETLPREIVEAPPDRLAQNGIVRLEQATDAARRAIALFQRVIELGDLDEAAAQAVRAVSWVPVPVHV